MNPDTLAALIAAEAADLFDIEQAASVAIGAMGDVSKSVLAQ